MSWLDFEIKKSKIGVTTRPDVVKNHLFKNTPFCRRHACQWFAVENHLVCDHDKQTG